VNLLLSLLPLREKVAAKRPDEGSTALRIDRRTFAEQHSGMSKRLRSQAKSMRASPKWSEDRLWEKLRARRCGGLKFKRQVPIGPYIADFACFYPRVIVEVDGGIHERLRQERDAVRDAWFVADRFRVLRFSSEEAGCAPGEVAQAILEAVDRAEPPPLAEGFERPLSPRLRRDPLPQGERET
jgi:very-short-patch-repair endonuclease